MQGLKNKLPMILFVLFELAVGILLLRDPQGFTNAAVTVFGIILIAVGAVYFINALRDKKLTGAVNAGALIFSVPVIIIGCICTFLTGWVISLFAVAAVIYGVILVLSGIFKIRTYFAAKREEMPVSVLTLISAALSFAFGLIIVINPFATVNVLWIFAGVSLIVEAVFDFLALMMNN